MPPSPSFQSPGNIAANTTIVFPKHPAFFLEQNQKKSSVISSYLELVLCVSAIRINIMLTWISRWAWTIYVAIMNSIFSAQRLMASYITGGVYLKPQLLDGLFQYLAEYVYNRLQFSYGWYFTFVQGWVYVLLIYLQGFTTKQMVNPWKTYVKLSAVLMGSNGLTKGSLAFLNYPCCPRIKRNQA